MCGTEDAEEGTGEKEQLLQLRLLKAGGRVLLSIAQNNWQVTAELRIEFSLMFPANL